MLSTSDKTKCRKCKVAEGTIVWTKLTYKDKVYQYLICHECNRLRVNSYFQTDSGRKSAYKTQKKMVAKFPEKIQARQKVNDALRYGSLNKPKKCSRCKKVAKLSAHHTDYSKPLRVCWVCTTCHTAIHDSLV